MNIQGLIIADRLLWDANTAELDAYKHKSYLVSRVLNRGGLADLKAIFKFYTEDELRAAVLESNTLNQKAMYFMSISLQIDIKQFKCYNSTPQNEFLSAH
jgi:hypothetical protein